jgi:predicted phosphodiesterase
VDQKKLKYPILSEHVYANILGFSILMHHGEIESDKFFFRNRLTPEQMFQYAKAMKADFYVMGRTHNPLLEKKEGIVHINPGSPVPTVHDNKEPSIGVMCPFGERA